MTDTKTRLMAAATQTVSERGIAAASARSIAGRAELNQALIFYHFGTVSELLEAASRRAVDASAAHYREQFTTVTSLNELLALGRELHEHERATGNVALMAQLMSGAQYDPVLARAARYAIEVWTAEIEAVLRRVLRDSPLAEVTDIADLARVISAGFIGLELYDGVDANGATRALDSLESLGLLVDVVNDLGPIGRRALRAKVRSRTSRTPT